MVKRLRSETTMTLKWIAERLNMGVWTHVANRLYHVISVNTWDRPLFEEQRAQRMLREELTRLGWTQRDLKTVRKEINRK